VAYTGVIRVTHAVIFKINGKTGALQYLEASHEYLGDTSGYSRMKYAFPNVVARCLLCGASGCSRWKGYYVRQVVCTLMQYAGPVTIHLAQCRSHGVDYTYWPDILVPYLRPTIPTLKTLYDAWSKECSIHAAVDEVVGNIKLEFHLSLSTAYLWLTHVIRALILNHTKLGIRAPESVNATTLSGFAATEVRPIFEGVRPWRAAQQIILAPP
jgi:hypothetical protein